MHELVKRIFPNEKLAIIKKNELKTELQQPKKTENGGFVEKITVGATQYEQTL